MNKKHWSEKKTGPVKTGLETETKGRIEKNSLGNTIRSGKFLNFVQKRRKKRERNRPGKLKPSILKKESN